MGKIFGPLEKILGAPLIAKVYIYISITWTISHKRNVKQIVRTLDWSSGMEVSRFKWDLFPGH